MATATGNKRALVIIHYQRGFTKYVPYEEQAKVINALSGLIPGFGRDDNLVVRVNCRGKVNGTPDRDVRQMMARLPRKLKKAFDYEEGDCAFRAYGRPGEFSEVTAYLKGRGVEDVVLAGIFTSECVVESAIGANEAGFKVHTAPQLVADDTVARHEAGLRTLEKLAEITHYSRFM